MYVFACDTALDPATSGHHTRASAPDVSRRRWPCVCQVVRVVEGTPGIKDEAFFRHRRGNINFHPIEDRDGESRGEGNNNLRFHGGYGGRD